MFLRLLFYQFVAQLEFDLKVREILTSLKSGPKVPSVAIWAGMALTFTP
jgi:hypothetical protein